MHSWRLARGQREDAARQFAAIPQPPAGALAARYRDLISTALTAALAARTAATRAGLPRAGPHIALLLPMTGRAATPATACVTGS